VATLSSDSAAITTSAISTQMLRTSPKSTAGITLREWEELTDTSLMRCSSEEVLRV